REILGSGQDAFDERPAAERAFRKNRIAVVLREPADLEASPWIGERARALADSFRLCTAEERIFFVVSRNGLDPHALDSVTLLVYAFPADGGATSTIDKFDFNSCTRSYSYASRGPVDASSRVDSVSGPDFIVTRRDMRKYILAGT